MILIKLLVKGYNFKALWHNCKYWRRFMTSKHRPSHRGSNHCSDHPWWYVQIYYGHMYTCGYILWADILKVVIFLMLLRLAYHLLLDSTWPHLPGITATTTTTTTTHQITMAVKTTRPHFTLPFHFTSRNYKRSDLAPATPVQES